MASSITVICAACSGEIPRPSDDGSDTLTCPHCGLTSSSATTAANHADGAGLMTLPEVCPVPQSPDDGLPVRSSGSIQQFLTRLKSQTKESVRRGADGKSAQDASGYELGKVVAKGGMGAILAARDLNIRREVAMKVMLKPKAADAKPLLRFIEEAQITGQLEHPGIVPVHQLGVNAEGNLFYTMKFVKGLTLADIVRGLRKRKPEMLKQYPLGRLLNVFIKVCEAMAFAHSRGVIHRDLKPANIMVGEFGEVLVMDWGLGKVLGSDRFDGTDGDDPSLSELSGVAEADTVSTRGVHRPEKSSADRTDLDSRVESVRSTGEDDSSRTRYGSVLGTPRFMPPEQARGDTDELDERADVYSLGAILYNLLTLAKPVGGETAVETLTAVIRGEIVHPDDLEGDHAPGSLPHCPGGRLPSALSAVVMKSLAREKRDRYVSVAALQRDIEAWQTGFATQAEQAGTWRQIRLFVQRNRSLAGAVAAVFVALSIGLVATSVQRNRAVSAKAEVDQLFSELQTEEAARRKAHEAHLKVSRRAAPEFVAKAQALLQQGRPEEALAAAETAIALHDELAAAWHIHGRLKIDTYEFSSALESFQRAQEMAVNGSSQLQADEFAQLASRYSSFRDETDEGILAERMLTLAVDVEQLGDSVLAGRLYKRAGNEQKGLQVRLTAVFQQLEEVNSDLHFTRAAEGTPGDNEYAHFYWHHVTREDGLRLGLPRMNLPRNLVNITPLTGLPVRRLSLNGTGISDLTSLRDMPLNELAIAQTDILSIDELEGLPIDTLDISGTQVADINVLRGLPLKSLTIRDLELDSLAPLESLQLEHLELHSTKGFSDIGPLRGMPLRFLGLKNTDVTDISALAEMPLEILTLPSQVTDLSPLRGLELKSLDIPHTAATDLSALEGMTLDGLSVTSSNRVDYQVLKTVQTKYLQIHDKWFDDLSLIAHMNLDTLILQCPKVTDLAPLRGMKLKRLILKESPVSDLSPLEDMPPTEVELTRVAAEDPSPFSGMLLQRLHVIECPVNDISVLTDMPLHTLYLVDCSKLNDVSPVRQLEELKELAVPRHLRNIEFLREMSLQYINTEPQHKSPDQFWREYEARIPEGQ